MVGKSNRIVLVDDDVELCTMLSEYLALEGFEVSAQHEGSGGLEAILSRRYDLAILDVMLPGLGGNEVLERVRAESGIPIVMLTARGDAADRIAGLEAGADDYLPKPFEPRELLARINGILRRGAREVVSESLRIGDLRILLGTRCALLAEEPLPLTSIEFDLLLMFAKKPGVAISREALSSTLGRRLLPFDRTIDMHVVNLRKKLGKLGSGSQRILTVRSSGYMLAVEAEVQ